MIFFSVNVTKILDHLISDTGSYLVTKEKIADGEVAFSLVNTKGLTGEYTLLHLEFEMIDPNAESTIISINERDIVGVAGDAIRVKFNSATVEVPTPEPTPTVSPEVSAEPSAAPTLKPTSIPEPSSNASRVWFETSNMEENVKRFGKWSKIKRVKVKK